MMSFCRESVNSFIPEDFSQAFHRTPSVPPPPSPPSTGRLIGFVDDLGLTSCTETLGFESSDEISNLDLGTFSCNSSSNNEDFSSSCSDKGNRRKKFQSRRLLEKDFPPPLSSLSEKGRRNFMLRSVRKDGRLEIMAEIIERPEILRASRQNGRLTMHLLKTVFEEEEEETEERENETEEERESETEEEEREWNIPATGVWRCYRHELPAWDQHRQRCVTTI